MDLGVDPSSFDFTLDVQLNVDASAGEPAQVAYDWLERGLSALAGDTRAVAAGWPEEAAEAAKLLRPGDGFGEITIDREEGAARRVAARTVSEAGLRWLRDELSDLPSQVNLVTGRLDETGLMVGGGFTGSTTVYPQSSGWLQLRASVRRSHFLAADHGLATQQRWLDFLESFADSANPGYGQISYYYHGGRTAVEEMVNPRVVSKRRRNPAFTLGTCREMLRGYGWLTIVPEELLDRLGGVDALTATGAFARVRPLTRGGVSLLVTDDFRDYTVQSVEAAFRALAPVLPPGQPLLPAHRSPVDAPVIIVAADPAGVGGAVHG